MVENLGYEFSLYIFFTLSFGWNTYKIADISKIYYEFYQNSNQGKCTIHQETKRRDRAIRPMRWILEGAEIQRCLTGIIDWCFQSRGRCDQNCRSCNIKKRIVLGNIDGSSNIESWKICLSLWFWSLRHSWNSWIRIRPNLGTINLHSLDHIKMMQQKEILKMT